MTIPSIPDKLYFKIGEVSEIVGVAPYVLRYWETEFKDISPVKSRTNQRLYKRRDVDLILKIQELLYKEKFTIDGARKRLKVHDRSRKDVPNGANSQLGLGLAAGDGPAMAQDLREEIKKSLKSLIQQMQSSIQE